MVSNGDESCSGLCVACDPRFTWKVELVALPPEDDRLSRFTEKTTAGCSTGSSRMAIPSTAAARKFFRCLQALKMLSGGVRLRR